MVDTIHKKVRVNVTDDGSTLKVSKSAGELDRNMKGLDRTSSNAAKNFSKMSQGMEGVLVPAYARVAATIFAATAAFQQLSKAAELSAMRRSMDSMAQNTGRNIHQITKEVQKASGHMLSFAAAARQATIAATAGFQTKNIISMTKAARKASLALGRSFDDTFDRIFRGVTKAEPELLDELGIILRLKNASEKYAKANGLVASELNIWQKQQAVLNDVLEQTEDKFSFVGEQVNGFNQLKASWVDLKDTVLEFLVSAIQPLITYLANNTSALSAFSTLFALSTIKKAFPAFQNIFNNLEKSLDNREKKLRKINKRLIEQRKLLSKQLDLIKKQNIEKAKSKVTQSQQAFKQTLGGAGTPALKAVADAKIVTKDLIKSAEQSLTRIMARSGKQALKAGSNIFMGGALKGKPLAIVQDLTKSLKLVARSNKELVRETKAHKGITGASGAHIASQISHAINRSQQLIASSITDIVRGFTIGHSGEYGIGTKLKSIFGSRGPEDLVQSASGTAIINNTAALTSNTAALAANTRSNLGKTASGGSADGGAMIYGSSKSSKSAKTGMKLFTRIGLMAGVVAQVFTTLASKLIWVWGLFEIGKMAVNFLGDRFTWFSNVIKNVGKGLEWVGDLVGLGALFKEVPQNIKNVTKSSEEWAESLDNVNQYILKLEQNNTNALNPSLLEQKNKLQGVADALDSMSVFLNAEAYNLQKLTSEEKLSNNQKEKLVKNYNKTLKAAKKLGLSTTAQTKIFNKERTSLTYLTKDFQNLNKEINNLISKKRSHIVKIDLQIDRAKDIKDFFKSLTDKFVNETRENIQKLETQDSVEKPQKIRQAIANYTKQFNILEALRQSFASTMSAFADQDVDSDITKPFKEVIEAQRVITDEALEHLKLLTEERTTTNNLINNLNKLENLKSKSYEKRTKGNQLKYERKILDIQLAIQKDILNKTEDTAEQNRAKNAIHSIGLKIQENEYNMGQLILTNKIQQRKEDQKVLKAKQKILDNLNKEFRLMHRLRKEVNLTSSIGSDQYNREMLEYDQKREVGVDPAAQRAKRDQQLSKVKKVLKEKIQAASFELKVLNAQKNQNPEVQTLLDFRQKVLEIQQQHNRKDTELEVQKLITAERQLALAKLRYELEEAQLEKSKEKAEEIRQIYEDIAESFGSTISDSIYNALVGEKFDWKKALSDKLARIGSDMIGGAIQEGIFGKDGLMGSLTKGTGLESILFPESDVDKNIRETKEAIQNLEKEATNEGSLYVHDSNLLSVAEQQLTLFDRFFNSIMTLLERNRGGDQYEQSLRDYELCQDADWEWAQSDRLADYCGQVHQNMTPEDEKKYYDESYPYPAPYKGRNDPLQLNKIIDQITSEQDVLAEVKKGSSLSVSVDSISSSASSTLEVSNKPVVDATEEGTSSGIEASNLALAASKTATNALINGQKVSTTAIVMAIAQQAASDFLKWAFSPAANGAIFRGGFRAFANGGIVNKPTLGLVGEGKHNEAVVPLPDGRSIPVSGGMGDMNTNITVNVEASGQTNVDVDSENKRAETIGKAIEAAVTAKILEEKRPGGALSPY